MESRKCNFNSVTSDGPAVIAGPGLGYAVCSALLMRRGRWLCDLRIVAERQTGSRPILGSAVGIWPRAALIYLHGGDAPQGPLALNDSTSLGESPSVG